MRNSSYLILKFIKVFIVTISASLLVCLITILFNPVNNTRDLWAFMLWSAPFALAVGGIAILLHSRFQYKRKSAEWVKMCIIGSATGVVWTIIVSLLLGNWFALFSFPVVFCWIGGGISGLLVANSDESKDCIVHTFLSILAASVICFLMILIAKPVSLWIAEDQQLEIIFIEWIPGEGSLYFEPHRFGDRNYGLYIKEIEVLKAAGLRGKLAYVSGSISGTGKLSRVVIVADHQISERVRLDQPNNSSVIYVQDGKLWRSYPDKYPTIGRKIELWVDQYGRIRYWVENADGSRSGGTAYQGWP